MSNKTFVVDYYWVISIKSAPQGNSYLCPFTYLRPKSSGFHSSSTTFTNYISLINYSLLARFSSSLCPLARLLIPGPSVSSNSPQFHSHSYCSVILFLTAKKAKKRRVKTNESALMKLGLVPKQHWNALTSSYVTRLRFSVFHQEKHPFRGLLGLKIQFSTLVVGICVCR